MQCRFANLSNVSMPSGFGYWGFSNEDWHELKWWLRSPNWELRWVDWGLMFEKPWRRGLVCWLLNHELHFFFPLISFWPGFDWLRLRRRVRKVSESSDAVRPGLENTPFPSQWIFSPTGRPPRKKKQNRRKTSRGAFATAFQELNPACGVALLKTWLGQETKTHSSLWWQFWCGLRRRPRKSWHVCPHCLLAFSFFTKNLFLACRHASVQAVFVKRGCFTSLHTQVFTYFHFSKSSHTETEERHCFTCGVFQPVSELGCVKLQRWKRMLEVTLCVLLLHFVWPKGLSYYKLVILFHHFLWSGVLAFSPSFSSFFSFHFSFFSFFQSSRNLFFFLRSWLAGWA